MLATQTVGAVDFSAQSVHNANVDWFYKAVGAKLKTARRSAGLTQSELGKRVDLSRVSVTNIERGAQHFPAHMLIVLAKAVGIDPVSLVPNEPTAELISPELLDDVSAVNQEWIKKILGSGGHESPQKGKNAKKRRSGKEVTH